MGLVTLRRIRVGEELFAPYVTLGQSVEDRRQELLSRFFLGRATAAAAAAAAAGAEGETGATPAALSASQSSLTQQQQLCSCPRCVFEAGDDARLCGPEILKVRMYAC